MGKIKYSNPISLIGASQSGKTTLAIGLAKTSDPEFTVGFGNDATRSYLEPRMAGIAAGHWPEASIGENADLSLNLNLSGGETVPLSFKEYMGEKIRDRTYIEKIVGNPKGALILISPGMDILRDPKDREEMLGNLKSIIDHLKNAHCVAVALVVTACDRLSTDLKEFKPRFEDYVSEVTNYLSTSAVKWQRFDVTITGELQDQNAPTIAVGAKNTARKPFVWVMNQIRGKRLRDQIMKGIGRLGVAVVAIAATAAITIGAMYGRESCSMSQFEKDANTAINKAKRASGEADLKSATDGVQNLIARAETNRCFRFSSVESRRTNLMERLRAEYDTGRADYLRASMNARKSSPSTRGCEKDCAVFDTRIADYKPQEEGVKKNLVDEWTKIRPAIRKGYDEGRVLCFRKKLGDCHEDNGLRNLRDEISEWEATADYMAARTNLLAQVDGKIDRLRGSQIENGFGKIDPKEPTRESVEDLRKRINDWSPQTEEGRAKHKELQKKFKTESPKWYQTIADNICKADADEIVNTLKTLHEKEQSADIRDALMKVGGFASAHTNASQTIIRERMDRIAKSRTCFLEKFAAGFSKEWTATAKKRPTLSQVDHDFIVDALDVSDIGNPSRKLSECFLPDLESRRTRAEKDWESAKKKIVDEFIANELADGRPVTALFDAYRKDYDGGKRLADNPFVTNVTDRVFRVVAAYLDQYVASINKDFIDNLNAFNTDAGRRRASERFAEFQKLCLALDNDSCGLANTWCAAFASECVKVGQIRLGMNKAFEQELAITRVEVKVSEDGNYNDYLGAKFGLWLNRWEINEMQCVKALDETYLRTENYDSYVATTRDCYAPIYSNPITVLLNPWTCSALGFYATLDLAGTAEDAKGKTESIPLPPIRAAYDDGQVVNECKCHYLTWGGKDQCYTCSVTIHCTIIKGVDIFEIYAKCRKSR